MFEPCVLGVDPGVAATGIAAVGHRGRHAKLLWADTIRTPSNLPEASRLRYIHDHVRPARGARQPPHGPGEVPTQPDAADAVAIALCHLTQTPLRRAARAVALR